MLDFLEMQIVLTRIKSSVGGLSCRLLCTVPVSPRRGQPLSEGGANGSRRAEYGARGVFTELNSSRKALPLPVSRNLEL